MRALAFTETQRQALLQDFTEFLGKAKTIDSSLTYQINMAKVVGAAQVPIIYYTPEAYIKMTSLVNHCTGEVAWHGIMKELPNKTYLITDILIYPQVVSGASVDTDQQEYETWLNNLPDDVFNNLRMQGHSHVNMATTPSGADWTLYTRMLEGMTRIPFYFFTIVNKRGESFNMLYDFTQNVCFETKDILMEVLMADDTGKADWVTEQMNHVKTHTVVTPTYNNATYLGNRNTNEGTRWNSREQRWEY